MLIKRYLETDTADDLKRKMVFIGGPRQVGKTSLSLSLAKNYYKKSTYLNWDSREDRKKILSGIYKAETDLIIFDKIHKFKKWKNHLKGEYDKNKEKFNILVTGSARLDLYRRGGDSLMGRYHYYRLHPFSLKETIKEKNKINTNGQLQFTDNPKANQAFLDLFRFGGFPEPFLSKNERVLRRFHNDRLERLVKEDIRDLENLRDLSALQILVEILPEKVGSLLSVNSLKEDLQVTHKTASLWVDVLERFYYHFRIYPFASTKIKSLRKEPKMYLWDWSQIENEPARLENIVASHLLKFVHFLKDKDGHNANLHFVRDTGGREADFLITINNKPWFMVEVKKSDIKAAKSLLYFKDKLKIPYTYQLLGNSNIDLIDKDVRIISADKFFTGLV